MSIKKILIANRGEIAVRIIKAAHQLGIKTVQVMSKADRDMLAVRLADKAIPTGPAQASMSYLRPEAIPAAAAANGVDTVHPGYGFLSESADFAAVLYLLSTIRCLKSSLSRPRREAMRARMAVALDRLDIWGLRTTTALHRALVRDPDLAAHRTHTRWLEFWLATNPIATGRV